MLIVEAVIVGTLAVQSFRDAVSTDDFQRVAEWLKSVDFDDLSESEKAKVKNIAKSFFGSIRLDYVVTGEGMTVKVKVMSVRTTGKEGFFTPIAFLPLIVDVKGEERKITTDGGGIAEFYMSPLDMAVIRFDRDAVEDFPDEVEDEIEDILDQMVLSVGGEKVLKEKLTDAKEEFERGEDEFLRGNYLSALDNFIKSMQIASDPSISAHPSARDLVHKSKVQIKRIAEIFLRRGKNLEMEGDVFYRGGNYRYAYESYKKAEERYKTSLSVLEKSHMLDDEIVSDTVDEIEDRSDELSDKISDTEEMLMDPWEVMKDYWTTISLGFGAEMVGRNGEKFFFAKGSATALYIGADLVVYGSKYGFAGGEFDPYFLIAMSKKTAVSIGAGFGKRKRASASSFEKSFGFTAGFTFRPVYSVGIKISYFNYIFGFKDLSDVFSPPAGVDIYTPFGRNSVNSLSLELNFWFY